MICTIYRSDTKSGLYIYLAKEKIIEDLDEELLRLLGKHTFVMELDLETRKSLANEDIIKVIENLKTQGYYVQLPTDVINNVINYG